MVGSEPMALTGQPNQAEVDLHGPVESVFEDLRLVLLGAAELVAVSVDSGAGHGLGEEVVNARPHELEGGVPPSTASGSGTVQRSALATTPPGRV